MSSPVPCLCSVLQPKSLGSVRGTEQTASLFAQKPLGCKLRTAVRVRGARPACLPGALRAQPFRQRQPSNPCPPPGRTPCARTGGHFTACHTVSSVSKSQPQFRMMGLPVVSLSPPFALLIFTPAILASLPFQNCAGQAPLWKQISPSSLQRTKATSQRALPRPLHLRLQC